MELKVDNYQQLISKKLAHKWCIHEIFLTGYEIHSQSRATLFAELPKSHGFYCEKLTCKTKPDLVLLTEVCRQACFVIGHTQFKVPIEGNPFQFLFQELDAKLLMQDCLLSDKPLEVVIESNIQKHWQRRTSTSALLCDFSLYLSKIHLADISIRMTWIDRTKWREMRSHMRKGRGLNQENNIPPMIKSSITPEDIGRINPRNVVLQKVIENGEEWIGIPFIDPEHPVLFDHPIDHIYAMVQLEACRQLVFFILSKHFKCSASELEMSECSARFVSVAEFDINTKICARIGPLNEPFNGDTQRTVEIEIKQDSRIVSYFTLGARCIAEAPEPLDCAR